MNSSNAGLVQQDGIRVLSLDGGDVRCMSQLKILGEIMHRVQIDLGKSILPCEFFHSMTGVGAGGIVAILLGVLGMSIDDATMSFAKMCVTLFHKDTQDVVTRSSTLEEISKELLVERELPISTRFRDDVNLDAQCKVSICYMSAINMGPCLLLRNYRSRHSSYNPTIIEAMKISWATPGIFSSIRVGPHSMQEELISAVNGVNNPAFEAIREANEIFGDASHISCFLSLGAGKLNTLSSNSENMLEQTAQDTEATASQLQVFLEKMGVYFRFSVERGLESLDPSPGDVVAHTSVYLHDPLVGQRLEECVEASKRVGGVELNQLFYTPGKEIQQSHGLPPLSAFFISRKETLDSIENCLLSAPNAIGQRVMVISALGGSGKSQLAIKFARDHVDSYDHILFVDASSVQSLQNGLVNRVKALDLRFNPNLVSEALELLAQPKGYISRNWLLILDNADDINVPIQRFLPQCDHGSILITTRNPILGNLAPENHLALDVMTPSEAVRVLLRTSLGPKPDYSRMDIQAAKDIVQQLGNLPLAIVQAGCYIKMQRCLHDYLNLLQLNRDRLLRHPALAQRDNLKYTHSIYAAFDVALDALSSRALQILSTLSFLHFSHFPRPLITLAISRQFAFERYDLLQRDSDFEESIKFLKDMLCVDSGESAEMLDRILLELQQYSFITLVTTHNVVTIRLHPLLHAWAHDRLSVDDRQRYRAAALRLVICGTHEDDSDLVEFIVPQLHILLAGSYKPHINDQAAAAMVIYTSDHDTKKLLAFWATTSQMVKAIHGASHLRTTRASLELANACWEHGQWLGAEWIARRVVQLRTDTLGKEHPDTFDSLACLARGLRRTGRISEAKNLYSTIVRAQASGSEDQFKGDSNLLYEFALCLMASEEFKVAELLLSKVVSIRISALGAAHKETTRAMYTMADCYDQLGMLDESETLRREALDLQTAAHGQRHSQTLYAMTLLAETYCQQAKLAHAEKLYRQVVRLSQETPGYSEAETLDVSTCLAEVLSVQGRYAEAEPLWKEVADAKEKLYGLYQEDTLYALSWLGEALHHQTRFAESEPIWRLVIERRCTVYGSCHVETLTAVRWLATSLAKQGRHAEAEPHWREAAGSEVLLAKHKYPPLARRTLTHISYHYIRNVRSTAMQSRNRHSKQMPGTNTSPSSLLYSRPGSSAALVGTNQLEEVGTSKGLDVDSQSIQSISTHNSTKLSFRSDGYNPAKIDLWKAISRAENPLSLLDEIAKSLSSQGATKRVSHRSDDFNKGRRASTTEMIRALRKHTVPGSSDLANSRWNDILQSLANSQASRRAEGSDKAKLWNFSGPNATSLKEVPQESDETRSLVTSELSDWTPQPLTNPVESRGLRQCCECLPQTKTKMVPILPTRIHDSRARLMWQETAGGRRRLITDSHNNELNDARVGLAESLSKLGKYADAELIWRQVRKQRNIALGERHPETIHAASQLAIAVEEQLRYEEAECLWREVVKSQPSTSSHSAVGLCHLADLVYHRGGFEEAEKLYKKVIKRNSDRSQDATIDMRHVSHRVAESLFYQEKYSDAEPLLRELLGYRREVLGSAHEATLDCLHLLAEALYDQSILEESQSLFEEVVNGRRKALGHQHLDTLYALQRLALITFHQELYATAEPLLQELYQTHQHVSGSGAPETLEALSLLADTVYQLKRDTDATILYQELLRRRREALGRDHKDTLQAAARLAQILDKQKRYAEADKAWREAHVPPPQRPFLQRVLGSRRVTKLFVRL